MSVIETNKLDSTIKLTQSFFPSFHVGVEKEKKRKNPVLISAFVPETYTLLYFSKKRSLLIPFYQDFRPERWQSVNIMLLIQITRLGRGGGESGRREEVNTSYCKQPITHKANIWCKKVTILKCELYCMHDHLKMSCNNPIVCYKQNKNKLVFQSHSPLYSQSFDHPSWRWGENHMKSEHSVDSHSMQEHITYLSIHLFIRF